MDTLTEEKKSAVSVVIPVCNEEESVLKVIQDIEKVMKESSWEYEIIVVNDGSTDKTGELLKNYGLNVKLIGNEYTYGYGAAIKIGIGYAKNNIILISDADGTYPVKDIPKLLAEIKNCDMVVGSRTGKNVRIPLIRKPAKWFTHKLANYLTGVNIPDLNSGLRVMKKSLIEEFIRILPDGFSFTTTITLAMLTNGYLVKYIPIDYFRRKGKSKIKPIWDTLNFLQLIIRAVMYFNPLKIFLPISLSLFFAGFLLLLYRIFIGRAFGTIIVILFVSSLHLIATGMIADLINRKMK